MREIKFRAYNPETKKMFHDFDQNIKDVPLGKSIHLFVYETGLHYKTLMQYTGLKDINGKEVYEGDIVNDQGLGKGIVVFQSGCFFMMYDADTNMEFLGLKTDRFGRLQEKRIVEILGNIYENPELLNQ